MISDQRSEEQKPPGPRRRSMFDVLPQSEAAGHHLKHVTLPRRLVLRRWMFDVGCSMLNVRCSAAKRTQVAIPSTSRTPPPLPFDVGCSMLNVRCSAANQQVTISITPHRPPASRFPPSGARVPQELLQRGILLQSGGFEFLQLHASICQELSFLFGQRAHVLLVEFAGLVECLHVLANSRCAHSRCCSPPHVCSEWLRPSPTVHVSWTAIAGRPLSQRPRLCRWPDTVARAHRRWWPTGLVVRSFALPPRCISP